MEALIAPALEQELVDRAVQARLLAEMAETESSPSRWDEADAYLELNELGWSTRKIAEACETSQSSVSRFVRCARVPRDSRGSFWTAYAEAKDGAHVANNSGEKQWFTPAAYIASAVAVMGGIDLDPASCAVANEVVGAEAFYTLEDDGLAQEWAGRVWLNPPYGRPLIDQFCAKLAEHYAQGEVSQACVLANNATETGWFHALAEVASALCFPRQRVKFWYPDRTTTSPLQGQAVIYLGEEVEPFRRTFVEHGFTAAL
jgi:phage N-6-adenine-methyltransferase